MPIRAYGDVLHSLRGEELGEQSQVLEDFLSLLPAAGGAIKRLMYVFKPHVFRLRWLDHYGTISSSARALCMGSLYDNNLGEEGGKAIGAALQHTPNMQNLE